MAFFNFLKRLFHIPVGKPAPVLIQSKFSLSGDLTVQPKGSDNASESFSS